ncbi:MAG: ATP-binding protein [Verrucomicrobiota bacterium]
MRRSSFRFRLALISMALSGLVLLVFGLVAWAALLRSQLSALDQELTTFGFRFASRSGPNVSGERQEDLLVTMVGAEVAPHRFFAILNRREDPLFQSSHWPQSLDPSRYPPGTTPLDPQPDAILQAPKPSESGEERGLRDLYKPRFYDTSSQGTRYRLGTFRNEDVILVVGADLDQVTQALSQLRNAFLVALPAALAVIALGAWWQGRKALRPIRVLGEDMANLSASDLDQRLEVGRADIEFATIIETYNEMLERLERSFYQANRFSGDASHELKTPLAIMRATLERGLQRCRDAPEAQEVFSDLLEQTDRQGAILESLLLLSRADAGSLKISTERIDLSALLETWMEDASLLAESRSISIRSDIEASVQINGDPVLLQRVVHNLFSNAVRYNRDGGRIECQLRRVGGGVEWTVANTGDQISERDRERIFGRFERIALKEGAAVEGVGLGLSLAEEIIVAHGGTITVGDGIEGMVEFRVILTGS